MLNSGCLIVYLFIYFWQLLYLFVIGLFVNGLSAFTGFHSYVCILVMLFDFAGKPRPEHGIEASGPTSAVPGKES